MVYQSYSRDGAAPSVLGMILIRCNHVLNLTGDFRGAFLRPLVPSQTSYFEGATRSFRGTGPLGPPRNSTTGPYIPAEQKESCLHMLSVMGILNVCWCQPFRIWTFLV